MFKRLLPWAPAAYGLAVLLGSYHNTFFGVYNGTPIYANWGGAILPTLLALLLMLFGPAPRLALAASLLMGFLFFGIAEVTKNGVIVPVAAFAIIGALTSVALTRRYAAVVAYTAATVSTLVVADLVNVATLNAPPGAEVIIGGGGIMDAIFQVGIWTTIATQAIVSVFRKDVTCLSSA